jgi:metallophosphoesterase superfamily enzyme
MQPHTVSDDLVFVENAAYLPKIKTLVISDLQLGYEQQLRDAGANIIFEQATQMLGLLETLIAQTGSAARSAGTSSRSSRGSRMRWRSS